METRKSIYYEWVDVARGIGILLVVLGHAIADTTQDVFLYGKLFQIIYSFHMPLFFFLSGFCSVKVFEKRVWDEKKNYMEKRFKRLMIPYIFVGICYIPVKLLMAKYVTKPINANSIILGFLCGDNPNSQLWTLYVLFLDAVFICLLINDRKYNRWFLVVTSLIMAVASVFIDNSFMRNFLFETLFYVVGAVVREKLNFVCDKQLFSYKSIMILGGAIVALIFINMYESVDGKNPIKIVTAILGIMIVCIISSIMKGKAKHILARIGNYSMDIYIMANVFQVFVRIVILNKLHIGPSICLWVSFLIGVLFPVLCSKKIVRKYQITQKLILGIF